MPKIGPLFKWFGSKWQSAKHYPAPEHYTIIEPFAGSAGYSLNYADRNIIIWENDPNLIALWKWLVGPATSSDILSIPVGVVEGKNILDLGLSKGQALLLKHWQRTNNVGDCWTISPWGNMKGQWTVNTRARVAEQVYAVKHWRFLDPFQFIDVPATWFIDPPYLYNYRYRKTGDGPFSYPLLDSLVQTINRESLVIVCEARHPTTGKAPDYFPFVPSHVSVTSRRKPGQSHHSKELVFVRRPLLNL